MARAIPQPGLPVNPAERGWRPTGDADVVAYLGPVELVRNDGAPTAIVETLVASQERQALRYLRPCSDAWYRRMPNHGGVMEDLRLRGCQTWFPGGFQAEAEEQRRPMGHFISPESPLAQDAIGLRAHLDWVQAEPGIWAGYWVEDGAC